MCNSKASCAYIFFSDVIECDDGNGGCNHGCFNTPGGYYCECIDGYTLQKDGKTCVGKQNIQ